MPEWLRQLLWEVYDLQEFDPEMKGEWVWAGLPGAWALWTLLAGVAVGIWLTIRSYRREGEFASPTMKFLLAGLRCGLLMLALAFLLQPMWQVKRPPREETGVLVVLADESLSMGFVDELNPDERRSLATLSAGLAQLVDTGRVRRIDVVNGVLASEGYDLLGKLERRNHRLKFYAFGAGSREGVRELPIHRSGEAPGSRPALGSATLPSEIHPSKAEPTGAAELGPHVDRLEPRAPLTELGSALQYVYDRHRHERLAGILIISDGRNVGGRRPEDAARELFRAEASVPLFAVAVGSPEPPKNITVERVIHDPSYFVRNPLQLRARLRSRGYAGREVTIKLGFNPPTLPSVRVLAPGEPTEPIDRREVVQKVRLVDGHQEVEFPLMEFHRAGRYTGSVEVTRQDGEVNPDDNAESFEFEVRPDIRVLLVSGATSWEFRFLRELYRRQELIDMSSWLQSAGADHLHDASKPTVAGRLLTALPTDVRSLSAYDVFVLLDPDPRPGPADTGGGINKAWFAAVREIVSTQGSGLLYVAGSKFSPYLLNDVSNEPLLEILPVKPDSLTQAARNTPVNRFRLWNLTEKGAVHPVATALSPEPKKVFAALPGFFFYLPTATPKSGATVLATPTGGTNPAEVAEHVLWAEQPLGKGVVMWLAGDNTYLWRSRAEPVRRQFWLQLARYLSKGRTIPGEQWRLETDRREYRIGEVVTITALGGPTNLEWGAGGVRSGPSEPGASSPGTSAPSAEVRVEWPDGGRQVVTLRSQDKSRIGIPSYQGYFNPARDGTYTVRLVSVPEAEGSAGKPPPTLPTRTFKVETAGPELVDRTSDPVMLRAMARSARTGRIPAADANPGWLGLTLVERSGGDSGFDPAGERGNRLVIEDIDPAGPAAAAGLKRGEAVVALDLRPMDRLAEFDRMLDRKTPDSRVALTIESGGLTRELSVTLAGEPNFSELRVEGRAGLDRLVSRAEPVKKRTPTRPKGRYLWDRWWLFTAFAVLLSLEWGVRKIYRMM